MKNILSVIAIAWAGITTVHCQSIWNRIPLTGSEAKIISTARQPRFSISISNTVPLGNVAPQNVQLAHLQESAFAPEIMVLLFEKLGGEFIIGSLTGTAQQSVNMSGETSTVPGVDLGIRLGKRFDLRTGIGLYRSKWAGQFPVTVFPHSQELLLPPKTEQGSVTASTSGLLVHVETVFYITRGNVRPYVSGGVRWQFPTLNSADAVIADVQLPFEIGPAESSFALYAGAGAQWNFWKNAYLDAGCSFGKWPGSNLNPALKAGIGWVF